MAIDEGYTITPLSGKNGTSGDSIYVQYAPTDTTPQGQRHDTFQSGDKYMWQKVGDGSWSSAMKIVGEDGKNAITMTSATTPSGEYEGQIGVWQGQIYKWTSNAWVIQNGDLPTDAVLHYSFDEVPDYPDGTAYIRLIDNNTYDIQSTNYAFSPNTFSTLLNENGKLKMHAESTGILANNWFAYIQNRPRDKILKIKFRITELSSNTTISIRNGFDKSEINCTKLGSYEISFVNNSTAQYPSIYFYLQNGNLVTLIIDEIYIGNGSYSTPIIDNANGQNNATNNGGITTKGVSGKGIQFLQSSNAYITSNNKPLDGLDSWTISFWLNLNKGVEATSKNPRLYQFGYLDYCFCDNFYIGGSGASFNFATYKDNSHKIFASVNMSQYIGQTIFVTVETEIDTESTSTKRVYINGVLKVQNTGSIIEKPTYSSWSIGGNTGNQHLENSMIDDFQVFDRALTDTEVQALYQNKANTPKYYDLSDYSIEQIDDDNVVDHLTEKPQLLSKWLEIYNAKNVSSSLPTSNVSASGEYKGVIDSANEVGVIETDAVQAYITASNALRSALWGTNGYLVDMNKDSALSGSLDSLFSTYRQTLQKARTVISEQQASSASALTIVNSNPFCLIPVNAGGTVTTYENTGLRLQVFNGVTQLTPKASSATLSEGQWKVTTNGSNITAGSQTVGNGYIDFGNVSALNADTAVITFTITALVNGVTNTLYTTQKFSKSKEGADGRIYSLQTDTGTIVKADSGTLTPSSVTVKAYSWTGSSSPSLYGSGDLKAYENNVQVGSTVSQGNTITVTPSGDYPLVVKLFVHGTNTLLDTLTIPVLQEVKGDTGRGLVSSVDYYKLSANVSETFDSTTINTWTDTASSVPTAQLPYLHHAVLQTYSEAPLNEYGDDVIIREYVTNGANGTSTRYSSASATSSTTSIALNTITGSTAVVGDVIIANSLLFVVTAVGSTNATVQYKQSLKGADNKGISVLLSNQNPNVPSNSDGSSPVLTNTVTNVRVYENTTELKYDASSTANGYYKITVTATGCTHTSITDKGDYAQVNAISAMSADSATRSLTISGKRSDGTSFSFNVVQTITKSKKGNPTTISGTEIQYFQNQNGTVEPSDSEDWSDTPPSQIAGYYLWTRTKITYSDETVVKSYSVTRNGSNGSNGTSTRYSTASVTSSTESIDLSTITGGTAVVGDVVIAGSMIFSVTAVGSTNATVQYKASIKGEDNKSITVIMSAPNVNVSCDSSGTPTGYANTPTTIRVYQNTQELSYDGSGTSNGTWKATILSRSGCTGGSFTDSGVYASLSAITGMSSDNASRNITITGKRTDGTSFTTTVTQTLSKNKQGLQGGQGSRAIRYLGKSATKPNPSSQTSGAPTGLDTPIQDDWYFCTTDGAVYYCSGISGTTYTWTVITWLDTTTVPDYRLTACLEDMLELSDQITTNQTMNNFIDKYINVLIANEAFINYLSTKTINFKNSVSSITKENVQVNDRMIYMGKNPLEEGDQEFRFGISRCRRIVGNHQDWTKDYFTDYLSTGIFGLHTSGIIQATDGIYANVGSEVQKESPIEALFTNMSASDGTYNFYVVPYGEQGTKYAFKYSKDFIEWTTQIVDFDFDTYGTPTQVAYLNGNYIFTTSKNQSGSYLFYKTSIDGSFTKINTNMVGFYCAKIIYSKYTNNYYSVFSAETNSFVNCGKTLSAVVTVDENYKRIAGYVNDICMCVNNGTSYVIAVTGDESTHDNDGWVYRLGDADSFSSASYARLNANLRILAQTLYGAYPRLREVASNDNGLVFAVGGIQGTNEQEPAMFKIDVSTVDSQYNRLFYKEECKFTNQGRIYSIASIGNSFIMGNSYGEIVHIDANGELKTYGVVDPRKGKGESWGVSHINPLPHINAVVLSCIRYASATSTIKTGYAHFLSFGSELLNKPPRIPTSRPANPVDGDIWID